MDSNAHMINSYSQLCEDIFIFNRYINTKRSDIMCVEIGAYDGYTYSNTLMFEEMCDARCILVEPSPRNTRKIREARPRATVHQFAISDQLGTAEFLGDAAVSGLSQFLEPEYMERWNMNNRRKYSVLTVPASVLISISEIEYIDFLSIDVQGAEIQVLSSMNWEIPIGVIAVELESHHPEEEEMCRKILKGNGFFASGKLKATEIWHNPKYFRAGILFDPTRVVPISSFLTKDYATKHFSDLREVLEGND